MQNISDYIEWRGDLSFACAGFNEIDNLILSELAYLKFEGVVKGASVKDSISLYEAAKILKTYEPGEIIYNNALFKQLPDFLDLVSNSERFRNIRLSNYQNIVDFDNSLQFASVVFSMDSMNHFIAFRGTDNSLAGWREDFMMTYMTEVPAQKNAVIYSDKVLSEYEGRFYFGGHSKGGNLAVYAAINIADKFNDRIVGVYNNDGPGFLHDVIRSDKYQKMLDRITTFVPKSSVVGLFLEHEEEFRFVQSSETGISQHDPFSWEVRGNRFIYVDGLTKNSLQLDSAITEWLENLSLEKRAQFVETLFDILQSTGARTINELSNDKFAAVDAVFKSYKNLDETTNANLKKTIELFFKVGQKIIKNSLSEDIRTLLPKKRSKYIKL